MTHGAGFGWLTPDGRDRRRGGRTCGPGLRLRPVSAMVMSQGTSTFLACFAGFWLVWALVVMLCCFCSFLQRRLKRRREDRLRERCLRTAEMEPLSCHAPGYPSNPPPAPPPAPPSVPRDPPVPLQIPHPMPQAHWVTVPGNGVRGKRVALAGLRPEGC